MSEMQVKFLPRFLYLAFWRQKEQGLMYQSFVQETVSKETNFCKESLIRQKGCNLRNPSASKGSE